MAKQDKGIYVALINRIAIVLLFNQLLLGAFSLIFSNLETYSIKAFGDSSLVDLIFRMADCVIYFISFTAPVVLFNKMNKNAGKEIYEPQENEKMPTWTFVCVMGMCLGGIMLAAYANYYIVNAFIDYSEFSSEYLWSVKLDHTYQIVIFFIYRAIIPAVVEELLFRETICKSLKVYGKRTAVLISAVLFSLMHSNVEQVLYTFVAGLLLGWVYVESKSIVFPILMHFLNNSLSAVGDIIREKCSQSVYNWYSVYSDIVIWSIMFASLCGYMIYVLKRGKIYDKLVLKPDENGNEVAPLSVSERVSGFFSIGMIFFALYSVVIMAYYIYLSLKL